MTLRLVARIALALALLGLPVERAAHAIAHALAVHHDCDDGQTHDEVACPTCLAFAAAGAVVASAPPPRWCATPADEVFRASAPVAAARFVSSYASRAPPPMTTR